MRKLPLALLALALLPSCSPRDFLTRRLAFDLIAGSPTFRAVQQAQIKIGTVSNDDLLTTESTALQHHGWITATRINCPPDLAAAPCWDLALTPSGVEAFQPLIPPSEADKKTFTILAARRELVSVTGISKQGNIAEVEFLWRWEPLNEIGAAMYHSDQHFRSTATLRHFDDGWRIARGVPHPAQSFEDALQSAEPAQ